MQESLKKGLTVLLALSLCAAMTLLSGCSMVMHNGTLDYEKAEKYTAGGATLHEEIEKVEVNWMDGAVNIDVHNGKNVQFSETARQKLDEKTSLHYWVDKKTLIIQFCASGLDADEVEDLGKELTLSLPENLTLQEVSVNTVSADLTATQVQTKEFCFDSVSGDGEIAEMVAKEIEGSTVGGDLTLLDCEVKRLDFSSVSGDLLRKGGALPEEVSIDTVSGDAKLFIPKDADLTIEMDAVSGKLDSALPSKYVEEDEAYVFGRGGLDWSIETVSGEVTVDVE